MSTFVLFVNYEPVSYKTNVVCDTDSEEDAVYELCESIHKFLEDKKVKSTDWLGRNTGDFSKKNHRHLGSLLFRDSVTYEPYVSYINWHNLRDYENNEISIQIVDIEGIKNNELLSQDYDYNETLGKLNKFTK